MSANQETESTPEVECGNCGSTRLKATVERQKFLYGVGGDAVELTASVPVYTCQECGEAFTTGEAEDIRHAAVCRHVGVLSPDEIRAIRKRHGWSQTELAARARVGEASVKRWETGALIQNGSNDLLLRMLGTKEGLNLVAKVGRRTGTS